MSNKTILQSNNDVLSANNLELQNLIDLANTLPEAGTETNIETCKLRVGTADCSGYPNNYTFGPYIAGFNDILCLGMIDDTIMPTLISLRSQNFYSEQIFAPPFIEVDILKNSIIIVNNNVAQSKTNGVGYSGNVEVVNMSPAVLKITGDAEIYGLYCYLKDTLITLANNQTKKVQDITYQDDLLVWDFDNGCYASAKPLWIKQSQITTQYYHCVFEDNSTLDLVGGRGHAHRVFCLDTNQFEYANDCIGKTIMTQNGPMKLLSCDIIEDNVEFYNIITNYHMNCFANKVLTSTGFSNIYPIENMKYIVDTNREIIPIEAFANCPEEYYYGMRLGEQVNYTMERMNEKIQNMAAIALPKGE